MGPIFLAPWRQEPPLAPFFLGITFSRTKAHNICFVFHYQIITFWPFLPRALSSTLKLALIWLGHPSHHAFSDKPLSTFEFWNSAYNACWTKTTRFLSLVIRFGALGWVGEGPVVSAYLLFNFPLPSSQNLNYLSLWTTSTNKASFSPVPIDGPLMSPAPPRAPMSQHSFSFLRWPPQSPAGQREFHPRKVTVIPGARGRRPEVGGRGGRAEEALGTTAPRSVRVQPPSPEVGAPPPPPNVRGRKWALLGAGVGWRRVWAGVWLGRGRNDARAPAWGLQRPHL